MYKNKIAYEREKKEVSREKGVEHEEENPLLWANVSYVLAEVLRAASERIRRQEVPVCESRARRGRGSMF